VRHDFALLTDRRFVLLLTARTAAMLGTAFGPVALTFGVLGLAGATATTLSVVVAAEALSMVVFMLAGGVIADRLPRLAVMVVADIGAAAAWAGLAVMLITGWAPVPLLVALSALAGMATALFFPAFTGAIPEVVPADQLQAANAILRLGMNGARIGGFALAGGAVAVFGAGWTMVITVGLSLTSASLLSFVRVPRRVVAPAERGGVFRDLRDGWREFRSRQWLWVVVAQYSFVMMVLQSVWGVLGPVIANERMGGARGWSLVLAAESVGMLLGVLIAIRVRPRRPIRLVVLLSFVLAAPPLALGLGTSLIVTMAVAFAAGVAIDVLTVVWDTTMQREIPGEALSRVSAYDALGSLMLGPLGLLLAGPSVALLGTERALLVNGVVVLAASLAALCSPGVRRLAWPDPPSSQNRPAKAIPSPAAVSPAVSVTAELIKA